MVNKPKGDVLMTASELETKEVAPLSFFISSGNKKKISSSGTN